MTSQLKRFKARDAECRPNPAQAAARLSDFLTAYERPPTTSTATSSKDRNEDLAKRLDVVYSRGREGSVRVLRSEASLGRATESGKTARAFQQRPRQDSNLLRVTRPAIQAPERTDNTSRQAKRLSTNPPKATSPPNGGDGNRDSSTNRALGRIRTCGTRFRKPIRAPL